MKKILVTLIIAVTLMSCHKRNSDFNGKSVRNIQFTNTMALTGEKLPIEIPGARSVSLVDTLLLVKHPTKSLFFYSVYNLPELIFQKNILYQGRGENELLLCGYYGQYEKSDNEINMYVDDTNLSSYFKVHLTESLRQKRDSLELVTLLQRPQFPFFMIDDNTFISRDLIGNRNSYNIVDKNQDILSAFKLYNNITEDGLEMAISFDRYSKTNNKIAMAMVYLNQVNILDLSDSNNSKSVTTASKFTKFSDIEKYDFINLNVYYTSISYTDNYIYALYLDQPMSEWQREYKPVEIHVFDWDGNGIARFEIKEYIQNFDVDKLDKTLYGIDNMENIYRYDLPEFSESIILNNGNVF